MNGRGNRDVVGDLELVEEFPGVATTLEVVALVLATLHIDVGDEGGLTNGHTEGVAFQEDVVPLKADVPGLGGSAVDVTSVAVGDIREAPTSGDRRNPAGLFRGPPSTQAVGVGLAVREGQSNSATGAIPWVEACSVGTRCLGVGSSNTPALRCISNLRGGAESSTISTDTTGRSKRLDRSGCHYQTSSWWKR